MSTSAEDFFGGNAKSASFDGKPGINWHGIIDRIGEQVQATAFTGKPGVIGAPLTYPSGDPVMQLPITIVTDVRDPAVPNDDGRRTIYFEGEKRKAMKRALQAAGVRGPAVGDWLSLTYTADQQGQGSNPKKLYEADYQVNPNKAAGAGFFQGGQQQAQQAAQHQPPAPQFQQPAPVQNAGPFTNGAPQDNPANNWPPAGSIPAAAQAQPGFSTTAQPNGTNGNGAPAAPSFAGNPGAAPVNTAAPAEPVAAGAGGPVAQGRPWG